MNQKPSWLLYAAEARLYLDNMKPSKSGKREDAYLYMAWRHVCSKHGYEGGFNDWRILVDRLGQRWQ